MELNPNIGGATVRVQKSRFKWKTFGDSESLPIRNRCKKDTRRRESKRCCQFSGGERNVSEAMTQACDIHHWPNMQTILETEDLWILRHEGDAHRGGLTVGSPSKAVLSSLQNPRVSGASRHLRVPYDIPQRKKSQIILEIGIFMQIQQLWSEPGLTDLILQGYCSSSHILNFLKKPT